MPLYETICMDPNCPGAVKPMEHYYPRSNAPMKPCDLCGCPTMKMISLFSTALSGAIENRHLDRDVAGHEKLKDGAHWAYRRKSSISGKPEPVWIETWADQKAFCREEGLVNPGELPKFCTVQEDGKTVGSTQGMPGCWV